MSVPSAAHLEGAFVSSGGSAVLELSGVSRRFGGVRALDAVSFAMGPGEVLAVLGPSGCGKSTLLRVVAGLEPLDAGEVWLRGELLSSPGRSVSPERRGLGLVFQDFALFPHLDVLGNVTFGMRGKGDARTKRAEALRLLEQVGLLDRAGAPVHVLSGGQQQRVALARSLATRPSLLLMDEPFSGLDVSSRSAVREETLALLASRGCPAILVTHDPDEALEVATRVMVLEAGRVAHFGSPQSLLTHPGSAFAAEFLCGGRNAFDARQEAGGMVSFGEGGGMRLPGAHPSQSPQGWREANVRVVLRPEGVRFFLDRQACEEASVAPLEGSFEVESVKFSGGTVRVRARGRVPCGHLEGRVPVREWRGAVAESARPGSSLLVGVEPSSVHVFPRG